MLHHRFIPRSFIVLFFFACGFLVGCGGQDTSNILRPDRVSSPGESQQTGPSTSQSDRWVPPIVLRNPSPRQLEVYVIVTMGGYDRTSRETTTIGLSFGFSGQPVQFAGSERLTCNSTAIQLQNQVASFQIAEAPTRTLEGQTFICIYSAASTSATFTFIIPRAPVIRSPQDLAQVPRSTHTLVMYHVQGGTLMGVVALGLQAKAIAPPNAPNTGQVTLNTSAFPAGAGTISLTQALAPLVTQTGVPFKSLQAGGTAMTMVSVTWM
jgi:hypothetical protein